MIKFTFSSRVDSFGRAWASQMSCQEPPSEPLRLVLLLDFFFFFLHFWIQFRSPWLFCSIVTRENKKQKILCSSTFLVCSLFHSYDASHASHDFWCWWGKPSCWEPLHKPNCEQTNKTFSSTSYNSQILHWRITNHHHNLIRSYILIYCISVNQSQSVWMKSVRKEELHHILAVSLKYFWMYCSVPNIITSWEPPCCLVTMATVADSESDLKIDWCCWTSGKSFQLFILPKCTFCCRQDVEAVPMPDGQLCLLALPPECCQGEGPEALQYLKLFCRYITDRKVKSSPCPFTTCRRFPTLTAAFPLSLSGCGFRYPVGDF